MATLCKQYQTQSKEIGYGLYSFGSVLFLAAAHAF